MFLFIDKEFYVFEFSSSKAAETKYRELLL